MKRRCKSRLDGDGDLQSTACEKLVSRTVNDRLAHCIDRTERMRVGAVARARSLRGKARAPVRSAGRRSTATELRAGIGATAGPEGSARGAVRAGTPG